MSSTYCHTHVSSETLQEFMTARLGYCFSYGHISDSSFDIKKMEIVLPEIYCDSKRIGEHLNFQNPKTLLHSEVYEIWTELFDILPNWRAVQLTNKKILLTKLSTQLKLVNLEKNQEFLGMGGFGTVAKISLGHLCYPLTVKTIQFSPSETNLLLRESALELLGSQMGETVSFSERIAKAGGMTRSEKQDQLHPEDMKDGNYTTSLLLFKQFWRLYRLQRFINDRGMESGLKNVCGRLRIVLSAEHSSLTDFIDNQETEASICQAVKFLMELSYKIGMILVLMEMYKRERMAGQHAWRLGLMVHGPMITQEMRDDFQKISDHRKTLTENEQNSEVSVQIIQQILRNQLHHHMNHPKTDEDTVPQEIRVWTIYQALSLKTEESNGEGSEHWTKEEDCHLCERLWKAAEMLAEYVSERREADVDMPVCGLNVPLSSWVEIDPSEPDEATLFLVSYREQTLENYMQTPFMQEAKKETAGRLAVATVMSTLLEQTTLLHKANCFHRDIKPSNVLGATLNSHVECIYEFKDYMYHFAPTLTESLLQDMMDRNIDATTFVPRLADFSIARKVSDTELIKDSNDIISRTRTEMNSSQYVAPEVFEEAGYSKPVDIYALGVMYFEILAGLVYDRDDGISEEFKSHYDEESKLIQRMLEANPEKRITAEKCLEELDELRVCLINGRDCDVRQQIPDRGTNRWIPMAVM